MAKSPVDEKFPGAWRRYSSDAEFVRRVRIEAARIRREITGAPIEQSALKKMDAHTRRTVIELRRAKAKHAAKIARQFIAKMRGKREFETQSNHVFSYEKSILLDGLYLERERKFRKHGVARKSGKRIELDFKDMSFNKNPINTMNKLHQLVRRDCDSFELRLNFYDYYCLDVGPFLVLAVMWKDLQVDVWGGQISTPMSKVLNALGIDRELEMRLPSLEGGNQDVYPVPIMRSGGTSSNNRFLDPQRFEKVAGNLTEAIDKWLKVTASQMLSKVGRRHVLKLVTETLSNAERHGDIFEQNQSGDWVVSGFMAKRPGSGGQDEFVCNLAFLSTGSTIEETIATAPEPTKSALEAYVNSHKRRIGTAQHSESHLRTVYAMQDGVTRSKSATAELRNGTGLQDILEFYSDLAGGAGDASLAIVSGHTCILCNSSYMKGRKMSGVDTERQLWFNAANDRRYPPDPNHVIQLDHCLKGTLVSMSFTLDIDYLERTVDGVR